MVDVSVVVYVDTPVDWPTDDWLADDWLAEDDWECGIDVVEDDDPVGGPLLPFA